MHQVMTWGKYYWPYAMLVVTLIFLPAEIFALITNPNNTLSDYSWFELGVNKHSLPTIAWYGSLIAWLLFVVLITIHIWWKGI